MRTLLALIFSWLMPAEGRRRAPAEQASTAGVEQNAPTRRLIIAPRSPLPPEYLRGEDIPLIRPYLIAYERAHGIYHHQEAAA
ncbi:hypothetical protein SSP531S_57210 [Streptomyces spongiicola]|uniref:Uncharacterized protein n=1 Tax=Streptomyces spongiicola TaxID=1690221 RepID=A0A388T674_9ACTN|nr:hypothetical protein [Streptomyces spongiicola]GBQ04229.1 hypothetical protein SSP531S_57210 [Streptomyces spongiicola]